MVLFISTYSSGTREIMVSISDIALSELPNLKGYQHKFFLSLSFLSLESQSVLYQNTV